MCLKHVYFYRTHSAFYGKFIVRLTLILKGEYVTFRTSLSFRPFLIDWAR